MKKIKILIVIFLFSIVASSQVFDRGWISAPASTSEIQATANPREGLTRINSTTNTIWSYIGGAWRNTNVSSGSIEIPVNTLSDLQGISTNEIALIVGDIDLVNTNITLPTDVFLKYGGGSIVSTGTGLLKTTGDSYIDNALLNYQLNWDETSTGYLTNETTLLNLKNYPIDQSIANPKWDNLVGAESATENKDNLNKAIADTHLFNGIMLEVPPLDAYFDTAPKGGIDYASHNAVESAEFSIRIPSDFHLALSDSTIIRAYPTDTYTNYMVTSLETKNVKLSGGRIIGSRETHNYLQKRIIYTPTSNSSIDYTIGVNDALVVYNIPVTPSNRDAQVQEIASFINSNTQLQGLGYTAFFELNGDNSAFFVRNSLDGLYFRVYGAEIGGFSESLTAYDITYEMGISFIGVQNGRIENTYVADCFGDGLILAGNGLAMNPSTLVPNPDFINTKNIIVENSTFINNRRNNVSPIGAEQIVIDRCQIDKAGKDMPINLGSAPRLGIDCEPTRYRDEVTGEVADTNLVRGITISNSSFMDNEYGAINLYSSYNGIVKGNVANGRISAQLAIGGSIENNTVDFRLGEDVNRSTISNQRAFETTARLDTYTQKIELASSISFSNNKVFGRGSSAPEQGNEKGFYLQGWNIDASHNEVNNVSGAAFDITALRDSNIHSNIVGNLISNTSSEGIKIQSTALRDVSIKDNTIATVGRPILLSNVNTEAARTSLNMEGVPSLLIEKNKFFSMSTNASRFFLANRVELYNNTFNYRVLIDNSSNRLKIKDNKFLNGLDWNANGADTYDVEIFENEIYSTNTVAALQVSRTATSTNFTGNNVVGNRIYQSSGGASGIRVYNNGAQPDGMVISENYLMQGNPTSFINFTGDNSLIYKNLKLSNTTRPVLSQVISGVSNLTPSLADGEGNFVADYEELVAIPLPTTGMVAYVTGKGIAGRFVYNAALSATSTPATNYQGWIRDYEGGYVKPQWFGAVMDGVTDDRAAFLLTLDGAGGRTIYIDSDIFLDVEATGTKSIFLDDNTYIEGKSTDVNIIINNDLSPAFIGVLSSNINFKNITLLHDQTYDAAYDYDLGNDNTLNQDQVKNYMINNRNVTYASGNPTFKGPSSFHSTFMLHGVDGFTMENVIFKAKGTTANTFIKFGIKFIEQHSANQLGIVESTAPTTTTKNVYLKNVTFDGYLMGISGLVENFKSENLVGKRWSDLQNADGSNVGGEIVEGVTYRFPPPHLIYLTVDSSYNGNYPKNIQMFNTIDYGEHVGFAFRDEVSGFCGSMKFTVDCRNIYIDGYKSYRVDGLLDIGGITNGVFKNLYAKSQLGRFTPSRAYSSIRSVGSLTNVTFENIFLEDYSIGMSNYLFDYFDEAENCKLINATFIIDYLSENPSTGLGFSGSNNTFKNVLLEITTNTSTENFQPIVSANATDMVTGADNFYDITLKGWRLAGNSTILNNKARMLFHKPTNPNTNYARVFDMRNNLLIEQKNELNTETWTRTETVTLGATNQQTLNINIPSGWSIQSAMAIPVTAVDGGVTMSLGTVINVANNLIPSITNATNSISIGNLNEVDNSTSSRNVYLRTSTGNFASTGSVKVTLVLKRISLN